MTQVDCTVHLYTCTLCTLLWNYTIVSCHVIRSHQCHTSENILTDTHKNIWCNPLFWARFLCNHGVSAVNHPHFLFESSPALEVITKEIFEKLFEKIFWTVSWEHTFISPIKKPEQEAPTTDLQISFAFAFIVSETASLNLKKIRLYRQAQELLKAYIYILHLPANKFEI